MASLPPEDCVRRIEELSLNAWPAATMVLYDGWILRFAEGYTKRANSVSPLYPTKIGVDEKIAHCSHRYHTRGLPVVFKLTAVAIPGALDGLLADRGYTRTDETLVQAVDIGTMRFSHFNRARVEDGIDERWMAGYFRCTGLHSRGRQQQAARLLRRISQPVVAAAVEMGGRSAACGFGVIERGHVGIFDVAVAPSFRRRGLGREVVSAILSGARDLGAHTAYLQVLASNDAARALYRQLGFEELYRYWYRVEPLAYGNES